MNKILRFFILLLLIPTCLFCTNYGVFDKADLLSSGQKDMLENKCRKLSEEYSCGVYLVDILQLEDYGYSNIEEFSDTFYDENSLGMGEDRSGVMLLLSRYDHEFDIFAYGEGNYIFTDYGKEHLQESFVKSFSKTFWYDGFYAFLNSAEVLFQYAADGEPYDINYEAETSQSSEIFSSDLQDYLIYVICGFVIALITALIFCSYNRRKLKPVKEAQMADFYVQAGGVVITDRRDVFSHITQVRHEIEDNSSSSSGGTTISSHGSSHSSGNF